jgi:hypothetical protein
MSNAPARVALATAVFSIPMSVFVSTVYPTVAGGDSGELVAESCALGVAHPPGYPLFVLLSHVATKKMAPLLGGSPAWRSNLMSCAFASLAAVFVYLTVDELTRGTRRHNAFAAASAGVLYALSPVVWLYAISSEVFAMNNFFAALIVFLVAVFARSDGEGNAVVGAFVMGVAMCNQHTIVL